MRDIIACVLGIVTTATAYWILSTGFATIGLFAEHGLSDPAPLSGGKFDLGETEVSFTSLGYALLILAVVIGSHVGAALFYGRINPWETINERATAKIWWFIALTLTVAYSLLQFAKNNTNDGFITFILSTLEIVFTIYLGRRAWLWWKAASEAKPTR